MTELKTAKGYNNIHYTTVFNIMLSAYEHNKRPDTKFEYL